MTNRTHNTGNRERDLLLGAIQWQLGLPAYSDFVDLTAEIRRLQRLAGENVVGEEC